MIDETIIPNVATCQIELLSISVTFRCKHIVSGKKRCCHIVRRRPIFQVWLTRNSKHIWSPTRFWCDEFMFKLLYPQSISVFVGRFLCFELSVRQHLFETLRYIHVYFAASAYPTISPADSCKYKMASKYVYYCHICKAYSRWIIHRLVCSYLKFAPSLSSYLRPIYGTHRLQTRTDVSDQPENQVFYCIKVIICDSAVKKFCYIQICLMDWTLAFNSSGFACTLSLFYLGL